MSRDPLAAIQTPNAPAAIGPYAQGRTGSLAGRWVVSSGQVGLDPATGKLVAGGVGPETERALQNLDAVLKAANAGLGDVVKTTVFLADMGDFAAMNEVYGRYFAAAPPARSTVEVSRLPKDVLVEIDVIALA